MPKIIKLEKIKEKEILKYIKEGKIFIYPTDTIYGLGCDATNEKSVEKIREIKKRYDKPFSVIVQSKEWISKNFKIRNKNFIKKLPGPFTFILEPNKNLVAKNVSDFKLGVRIPDHSFAKIIQKSKKPFITTSVNLAGEEHIKSINEIPEEIYEKVDIIIDAGFLNNEASTVIDLTNEIPKIIR